MMVAEGKASLARDPSETIAKIILMTCNGWNSFKVLAARRPLFYPGLLKAKGMPDPIIARPFRAP